MIPLGNLNPDTTYSINHRASVRLARHAKAAGVKRFLARLLLQQLRFAPARPWLTKRAR